MDKVKKDVVKTTVWSAMEKRQGNAGSEELSTGSGAENVLQKVSAVSTSGNPGIARTREVDNIGKITCLPMWRPGTKVF